MRELWWRLRRAQLRRSSRPVIVGPFRGEVGLETLYWVPFVRAMGLDPDRVIPVTRGGAHLWYPAGPRHVDLYDLRDVQDVRLANAATRRATGLFKQMAWDRWDREVIRDAKKRLKLPTAHVVHPSAMYQLLRQFWLGDRGLSWLRRHTVHMPFPDVEAEGLTLPDEFIAVRFYYRYTFQASRVTNTVAVETIKHLAASHHVVVLNDDIHADDHNDVPIPEMENVTQLKGQSVTGPEHSLALQSAILSRSAGFVGTYGGLQYLAQAYRKPSIGFYADWGGTAIAHKHLSDAIGTEFGAPMHCLRVTEIPMFRAMLPQVAFTEQRRVKSDTSTDPVFAPKG